MVNQCAGVQMWALFIKHSLTRALRKGKCRLVALWSGPRPITSGIVHHRQGLGNSQETLPISDSSDG